MTTLAGNFVLLTQRTEVANFERVYVHSEG